MKSCFDFNVDEFVKCQSVQHIFVLALLSSKCGGKRKRAVRRLDGQEKKGGRERGKTFISGREREREI